MKLPRPEAAVAQFPLACLRRFIAIEGTLQATVLAAQAFTSLIPFMVVASAFAPGNSDLADAIVERFGLEGNSAKSVHQLFASAGETQSAVTWISVIILLLSALSFTRALQRLFQRAYGRQANAVKDVRRGLVWVLALAAWVTVTSPLRGALQDVGGVVFAVAISTVTGFLLWLATPVLLLGESDRRSPRSRRGGLRPAGRAAGSGLEHLRSPSYGLVGGQVRLDRHRLRASIVAAGRRVRAGDRGRRGRDRRRADRRYQPRAPA